MRCIGKRMGRLILVAAAIVVLAACGERPPRVDWAVSIEGSVGGPFNFTYRELVGMSQTNLNDLSLQESPGEIEIASWSGVPVEHLFREVGITEYSKVTAMAADGYAVEISREELADAIIALKKDGAWIINVEPEMAPVRLVCPEAPASRWVSQLESLRIEP